MSRYVVGSTLRCANCGKDIEEASSIIPTGEDDEWVCSSECEEEYQELGCPLESGNYRKK